MSDIAERLRAIADELDEMEEGEPAPPPLGVLELSAPGEDIIKHFESCLQPTKDGKFTAYLDPVGVPTIGWGHTNHHGRKFKMGAIWTQKECDDEFAADMELFEDAVNRLVTAPLQQHQFDALVSFTYNLGEGNLGRSTLLRKLNKRDYEGAANEFKLWNRAGGRVLAGLVRRRGSEEMMFRGFVDRNYDARPD